MVDVVTNCGERNRQKDAGNAQEPAADHEGDQDPDGGDAQLFAKQAGLDDIAVDGLQNQGEEQEPQRVHRLDQDQDKGADHRARHGTEGRSQVGDADDHRNDRDIGHLHDDHEDPVQQADDHAVQEVAGDVADQDRIAAPPEGGRAGIHARGQRREVDSCSG